MTAITVTAVSTVAGSPLDTSPASGAGMVESVGALTGHNDWEVENQAELLQRCRNEEVHAFPQQYGC
jgi:hypothetical protein